jgi:hypothetical protein
MEPGKYGATVDGVYLEYGSEEYEAWCNALEESEAASGVSVADHTSLTYASVDDFIEDQQEPENYGSVAEFMADHGHPNFEWE